MKHFEHCEVDSFVSKFKHLWHAGVKASLTIEAVNGQASVILSAGLGPIPPPVHPHGHHGLPPHHHRGPMPIAGKNDDEQQGKLLTKLLL